MALFDEKHKAQMKANGVRLRQNLRKRLAEGSDGSLFGDLGLCFSQNLLSDLETRTVRGSRSGKKG